MSDAVNHPAHYTYGTIETIDYIEDKGFTYNLGNAIKYISRAGHKLDAIEDLKKAVWYSRVEEFALRRVLRTLDRPGYGAALLMLETGIRVGECLALKWEDVLWNRKGLRINKTLIRINNRRIMEVQEGAKSHTSNRTIPLSKDALLLLENLMGNSKHPNGFIFADEEGRPMSYEAIRYQIQKACKAANVPYKGQHAFRHTFATNCYARGADVKILSKILGHSNISVTYDIYIHLFGDALEEMRSVVG